MHLCYSNENTNVGTHTFYDGLTPGNGINGKDSLYRTSIKCCSKNDVIKSEIDQYIFYYTI